MIRVNGLDQELAGDMKSYIKLVPMMQVTYITLHSFGELVSQLLPVLIRILIIVRCQSKLIFIGIYVCMIVPYNRDTGRRVLRRASQCRDSTVSLPNTVTVSVLIMLGLLPHSFYIICDGMIQPLFCIHRLKKDLYSL